MMFGAWGERDHDESIRIIHRALDAGINFVDTADVYSAGESEEIVGKALAGGRRDDVILATKVHGSMGDDPNQFGNSRRWIVTRGREQPAPPGDRLDRPLPDPPPRARHRHRRDARRAHRPGARRARCATSARRRSRRSQIVEAQWTAERRGRERFVCEQPPYSLLVRGDRARRAADLPAPRHGRDRLEPAGGRLAVGQVAQGRRRPDLAPLGDAAQALRPLDPGQPAQARRRRRARRSWPRRRA